MDCESGQVLTIDDLPEEVLEFILSLIAPYKDLHECKLVSKKWRRCVLNVVKSKQRNFHKSIMDFNVKWSRVNPNITTPTISKRYSHAAVVCGNSMYIFGGCTSTMTTFNDLWKLDLSSRTWVRPVTMGSYPAPKACSTLISYKDILVLFGGWTYPPAYPLYQSWHLFNELHVYNIKENKWTSVCSTGLCPPPMAGHSACIVDEYMIVFGGLQKPDTAVHCEKSNDIWKLHLETWEWCKQEVEPGPKPTGRFGQTQVILDEKNLLILGGSGGLSTYFCDCWILNMEGDIWKWINVKIAGKINEPANIWSNPGCKIGNKIVILNRIRRQDETAVVYYPKSHWSQLQPDDPRLSRIDVAKRLPDRDENVNGRRGDLKAMKREMNHSDLPSSSDGLGASNVTKYGGSSALTDTIMPNYDPNKQYRRNSSNSRDVNDKEGKLLVPDPLSMFKKEKQGFYLGLYVLDVADVLKMKTPTATWLTPKNLQNGPEETILYSLLEGRSELVMFGGILKDGRSLMPCSLNSQISNSLYFISAPNYVI